MAATVYAIIIVLSIMALFAVIGPVLTSLAASSTRERRVARKEVEAQAALDEAMNAVHVFPVDESEQMLLKEFNDMARETLQRDCPHITVTFHCRIGAPVVGVCTACLHTEEGDIAEGEEYWNSFRGNRQRYPLSGLWKSMSKHCQACGGGARKLNSNYCASCDKRYNRTSAFDELDRSIRELELSLKSEKYEVDKQASEINTMMQQMAQDIANLADATQFLYNDSAIGYTKHGSGPKPN